MAKTFVVALREFFGMKPGETLQELMVEIKALTPKDRKEFTDMLRTQGYDVQ